MSLEIGSRIGDYEIVAALGAGGMGKVFKVRNVISDRVEAMKVLLPDLATDPELGDRFIREIKVQGSLQHPNIAALHTALRVDNQLLMLMELVEGVTIEQRLHQGPIPLHDGVDYVAQVLNALAYAHEHGVIHRDIKPANMMLMPNGMVKLMDFGIAKAAADRKLTMTGTTMGSLYYMSPEQIKGMVNVDARSDLYSVGVSLYEIVTGKKPFDGDSQFAIMAAHLEKLPVPPITLDTNLPQALNDVILMSIVKEPGERFQTAKAFAAALGSVRQGLGMPAAAPAVSPFATTVTMGPQPAASPVPVPVAPVAQAERPKSGKRWVWVSAGGLAAVLVLVAAIQFGPWRNAHAGLKPEPNPAPPKTIEQQPPPPVTPAPTEQHIAEPGPIDTAAPPPDTKAAPQSNAGGQKRPPRQRAQAVTPPQQKQFADSNTTQQVAPGGPPASAGNVSPPQQQPAAPDPSVLQDLRERLVQVDSRAGAVRTSLGNLKRAQAAQGMSLRGDMASAETHMNYLLEGANAALNNHDAPATKKFLDSAEAELEKLEKFLGI